jgi:hypothetical protein
MTVPRTAELLELLELLELTFQAVSDETTLGDADRAVDDATVSAIEDEDTDDDDDDNNDDDDDDNGDDDNGDEVVEVVHVAE